MNNHASWAKVALLSLAVGAIWFCANAFTSPAPFASKVFGFTAQDYSTSAAVPDTCGTTRATYDGTTDYAGTSGNSFNEDDDDQITTYTVSGAAVNAWEGSGQVDLEVDIDYLNTNNPGSCGWCATFHALLAGYSLDVTYNIAGGGTATYTRQHHASGSFWTWTFQVPEYNGQLASIDFDLQVLTDCTVGIEFLDPINCNGGTTTFETDLQADLWKL